MFLMGPVEQLKSMFSADRWGATTVYLATVVRVSADSHRAFSLLISFASVNCPTLKWFVSSFSLGFPVNCETGLDHFHGNQDSQRDSRAAHDWNSASRARVVLAQLHSVCTRHGLVVRAANDGPVGWPRRATSKLGFVFYASIQIAMIFRSLFRNFHDMFC
jgi:hypothetical protein